MSKNRLPVTDLANIIFLPETDQWRRLAAKRKFVPPHTLEPTRRNMSMLLGVHDPLFPAHERPPKIEILRRFHASLPKGEKRAKATREANMRRAEAMLDFADQHIQIARSAHFDSLVVGGEYRVRTADPFSLVVDGQRVVPSTDLRASGSLSELGRKVYFNLNYHMIIDRDPDFEEFGQVLLDFYTKGSDYGFKAVHWDGVVEFTYDDLDKAVRSTLAIWDEIVTSRRASSRDEDDGTFFGEGVA